MPTPFFSIVIPTKNRPFYLKQAIQSALWQDFEDFEVIASDNFNTDETQQVVSEFKSNEKFSAYRTEREMGMPDHWEWATKKAQGKYVIILPDRKLLFQGALHKIYRTIKKQEERFNVYSYAARMFDEDRRKMGWTVPKGKSRIFKSSGMIDNFIHKNFFSSEGYDKYFPKAMNSCYKNSYVNGIRNTGGRYFNNVSVTTPDYSSLMVNLALNDTVYYLSEYIILAQGEHLSTGRLFGQGKTREYLSTLPSGVSLDHLPSRLPTSFNAVVNDFLVIQSIFEGNLKGISLDLVNYFSINYYDLLMKKTAFGANKETINKFEAIFNEEINQLGPAISASVKKECERLEKNIYAMNQAPLNYEWMKLHLNDFLYNKLKNARAISRALRLTYSSALDAAGFSN